MNITAEEIVTELSMSYSHTMHLLVEGNTDLKLFQSLIQNPIDVNIIDACGSDTVIASIALASNARLQNPKIAPILGVIDRDYHHPIGRLNSSPDLIITDLRDVECMMIDSPALDAVLTELGSAQKLLARGGRKQVKETILSACRSLAHLRYLSAVRNMNICFQKIDLEKFVDRRTMTADDAKLVAHLSGLQAIDCPRPTSKTLEEAKVACAAAEHPPGIKYFTNELLLIRGHDLMAAVALGLRSLWGSLSAGEANVESIERHFRLAFRAHFHLTSMCSSLLAWLTANALFAKVRLHN